MPTQYWADSEGKRTAKKNHQVTNGWMENQAYTQDCSFNGRLVREVVNWNSHVLHEDAWLMPIRPEELIEDCFTETQLILELVNSKLSTQVEIY